MTINLVYIMLCGVSGSGKTTLRKEIVAAMEVVTLATDDYIEYAAKCAGITYTEMFEHSIKTAESLMNSSRAFALNNRLNIIHDQTNLSAKSRAKKLSGIPSCYTTVCLFLSPPEDEEEEAELQRRLMTRPGKVLGQNVVEAQRLTWVAPTSEEDFDIIVPSGMWMDVLSPWIS